MANPSVPNPGSTASTAPADKAAPTPETIKSDANAALGEARDVAGKIAGEATDQVSQLADQAKEQVAQQADKLKGLAGEQKDLLAAQIGGVADAMEKVATELEANNGSSAHYARLIADNAEQVSTTIRQNDVDALLNMAQDFGRKQPAAFVGVAALLGFAASRFLLASANRSAQSTAPSEATSANGYRPATPPASPITQDGRM
jgi:hypothetical protein